MFFDTLKSVLSNSHAFFFFTYQEIVTDELFPAVSSVTMCHFAYHVTLTFLYTAPGPHFQASVAIPCPSSELLHYMKIIKMFFLYRKKTLVVTIIYTKIKKSLSRSRQAQTKPKKNQSRGLVLASAKVGIKAVPSMSAFHFFWIWMKKALVSFVGKK